MKKRYQNHGTCFICTSPYQLIGAIGIAKKLDTDSDLYISGEFPGYDVMADRLRKYDVFSNVYVADSKDVMAKGRLASIKMTFLSEKALAAFLPADVSYDACYVSSRSTLKATMLSVLRKRNPDMRRVIFDDGLGTYSGKGNLINASPTRGKIERLLGRDLDNPEKIDAIAYLPELVSFPGELGKIKIGQQPRIELNEESRTMLTDVFEMDKDSGIDEKYIVFDTKRRGGNLDAMTNEEKDLLDECYRVVKEYAGDDIICKPHPKSVEEGSSGIRLYPYQGIPMEALYLNMRDIDDRVLVSHVSTAVFSPKIFLGKEPRVICLHKILKDNPSSITFESIYEKFRNTYSDPERVIAPISLEELADKLRSFCPTHHIL